jgi:hypothetical protein
MRRTLIRKRRKRRAVNRRRRKRRTIIRKRRKIRTRIGTNCTYMYGEHDDHLDMHRSCNPDE